MRPPVLDAPEAGLEPDWQCAGDTIESCDVAVEQHTQNVLSRLRAEMMEHGVPDTLADEHVEAALAMQRAQWAKDRPNVERDLATSAAATRALLRGLGYSVSGGPGSVTLRVGSTTRTFGALHEALSWATRT